jgi:alanine dehydrogenase
MALTTATLPYVLQLARQGLDALRADPGFGKGVNTYKGYVTSKPVAEALGLLAQYKEFVAL